MASSSKGDARVREAPAPLHSRRHEVVVAARTFKFASDVQIAKPQRMLSRTEGLILTSTVCKLHPYVRGLALATFSHACQSETQSNQRSSLFASPTSTSMALPLATAQFRRLVLLISSELCGTLNPAFPCLLYSVTFRTISAWCAHIKLFRS